MVSAELRFLQGKRKEYSKDIHMDLCRSVMPVLTLTYVIGSVPMVSGGGSYLPIRVLIICRREGGKRLKSPLNPSIPSSTPIHLSFISSMSSLRLFSSPEFTFQTRKFIRYNLNLLYRSLHSLIHPPRVPALCFERENGSPASDLECTEGVLSRTRVQ
ncbi:hypothetical protein M432DRAFT_625998 [Thermoascus aurantiacus ATCC 26904]